MELFDFRGSHFDVGFEIGRSFGQRIRKSLATNIELQDTFLPFHRTPEGKRRYQELIQLHRSQFPHYVSELEGISQGAGVSVEELFLVNMRAEYRRYPARSEDFGCSTCALLTADSAVLAHNEDGSSIYLDQLYLARFEIVGKPAFTALCYPGFLAGNAIGYNAEGLCFFANDLQPKRIVTGWGRHFIARSLFEARSLDEAIQLATISNRASGFNFTIGSTKQRRMVNLEISPDQHHIFEIQGRFFHANHYLDLSEVDQFISPSSKARQRRAEMLLAEGVARDEAGVLSVLRGRRAQDYPILRDGKPPDGSVTLATALFDLDSKGLTIYPGSVGATNFRFEPLIQICMTE